MYLLGFDIGSSSVKAAIVAGDSGRCLATSFSPDTEMQITAPVVGWAEQDPNEWWANLKLALGKVIAKAGINPSLISSIGISYQMHGLVAVDKELKPVRPSIIWCDSRATQIGEEAFELLGKEKCLSHLLNGPGNFTASKLKWVRENEPETYSKIYKIMLPGDYIAMRLTGEVSTTVGGLSEGIMWDFSRNELAGFLLDHYNINPEQIPYIVPTFSAQGALSKTAAEELGLPHGTIIGYRSGDQPNNAFSLNVLNPGEVATTAGTSGVVYGVSEIMKYDRQNRVNTFAHVNHSSAKNRLGVLLCINGTGILNAWIRRLTGNILTSYEKMNETAASAPIGSEGLRVLPFGNGAERMLGNHNLGAHICGVNFNTHDVRHLARATQEGIAFSFKYGMDILHEVGISTRLIRAARANMFLSPLFRNTLAGVTGATIELYETDGAIGAALAGGYGAGFFADLSEALAGLNKIECIEPVASDCDRYATAYQSWLKELENKLQQYLPK